MAHLLALFIHVASAMGLFAALGLEAALLLQLRGAAGTAQRRTAMTGYHWVQRVGGPSTGGILLSGLVKPGLLGSLIALAIAIVLGVLAGRRRERSAP